MLDEGVSFLRGFSNYKKIVYILIFFTITPITLIASLASLISLNAGTKSGAVLGVTNTVIQTSNSQIYSSESGKLPTISIDLETGDARPNIIKNYLLRYDSPLSPYADFIVKVADKYQIDYRLITAIAQQESNLCKKIPDESFNCWGWGIHSKGTLMLNSYEEGIETVSLGIKEEYLNKGYTTPEEIMSKYTPLSNGSWAFGVNSFMDQLQ